MSSGISSAAWIPADPTTPLSVVFVVSVTAFPLSPLHVWGETLVVLCRMLWHREGGTSSGLALAGKGAVGGEWHDGIISGENYHVL